jgi:hypothetical protein
LDVIVAVWQRAMKRRQEGEMATVTVRNGVDVQGLLETN